MSIIAIIIIALGLSADSFAISVSSGIILKKVTNNQAFKIAGFLAIFQAIMPVIGWFAGNSLKNLISDYDHWVAFSLLFLIGAKMIYENFSSKPNNKFNPLDTKVLIGLSIATSIDALVIGVGLGLLDTPILLSSLIIGIVTFIVSLIGVKLGCKFCKYIDYKLEAIAGGVLILLGLKILIEHLYF
jgi:putative Mn2+ efflux pump MntP